MNSRAQGDEGQRRIDSRLGVKGQPGSGFCAVTVDDQDHQRDQQRPQCEPLGQPGPEIHQQQGGADQEEIQGGGGGHSALDGTGVLRCGKEHPVDPQVPRKQMLGEGEQAQQPDQPGASLGEAARPSRGRLDDQQPERSAGQDKGQGAVGLHDHQAGKPALQHFRVGAPGQQGQHSDQAAGDARQLREHPAAKEERISHSRHP